MIAYYTHKKLQKNNKDKTLITGIENLQTVAFSNENSLQQKKNNFKHVASSTWHGQCKTLHPKLYK